MSTRRAPLPLTALVTAALLLAGCSAGDDASPPATVAPPATSPTTSRPGPDASTPADAAGCTGPGDAVPAGAASVETIDLDGDDRPDALWIASDGSTRTLGVTTAAGATTTVPVDLAGPAGATAFALHPDAVAEPLVLLSDGRVADLLAVRGCALVQVTDAGGAPWRFDQGFAGQGTGVGCVDLDDDGALDLVGLDLVGDRVTRSAIGVDGTVAGATGTQDEVDVAGDAAAQESARALTCGDRTATADGVHEPAA